MIETKPFKPEQIVGVSPGEVPRNVAQNLWVQTLKDAAAMELEDFNKLFLLQTDDELDTYMGYNLFDMEDYARHHLHLVDWHESGRIAGTGEVLWSVIKTSGTVRDPHVMDTATTEKFRHRGIGRRRILAMQAASLALFNMPLSSDQMLISPHAKSIWRTLVREGLAETYQDPTILGVVERFRFIA